jgi:hypothetical protein
VGGGVNKKWTKTNLKIITVEEDKLMAEMIGA